ncbi:MAG: AmmeMemoRadiSam system protein B [Deltaproteobacteria bacterium]|nr:AmmeMemoRadiSam system protein B [Deltaproteobacteria bacterium]
MGVRAADLAGSWYPATESECLKVFEKFEKESISPRGVEWTGGIVPHAGWVFSGQVAYDVIKHLKGADSPDTIIIFGRHLHPGSSNYIMNEGSWDTPLGELEIAYDIADKIISEFRFNVETSARYATDNTVEVQLPIIRYIFPGVRILPVGVPPAPQSITIGERIAEIAIELGHKIKVLGSTDLTHYGPNYDNTVMGTGQKALDWVKNHNDRKMVDLMLKMEPEAVIEESLRDMNACCGGAVSAAIASVKKLGAGESRKLIYTTSYDVMPGSSFVGYAGVVFR